MYDTNHTNTHKHTPTHTGIHTPINTHTAFERFCQSKTDLLKLCCQFLVARDFEIVVKCISKLCRKACIPVMVPRVRFIGDRIMWEKEDVRPHIKTVSCIDFTWMNDVDMQLLIGLRHLQIKDRFISTPYFEDWKIPDQITHLTLMDYFNQPIVAGVLPTGLHTLVFGPCFNQPIVPGVLPPRLHTLKMGQSFDQHFAPGSLPPKLHTLILGECYNQQIGDNVLPPSLKRLSLPTSANTTITEEMMEMDDLLSFTYSRKMNKKRNHP